MTTLVNPFMSHPAAAAGGSLPYTTGLFAHFDADAITGKVDGNTVSTWSDSSGNGRTATAPAGEDPTYKTGIIGGKPVLRFSATTTKRMATAAWSAISQPYTLFIVGRTKNVNFSQLVDGIVSGNRLAYFRSTSDGEYEMFAGASSLSSVTSMSVNQIHALVVNGASSRVRHGGGTGNAHSPGTQPLTGLTIGNRFASTYESGEDIAEVILYTGAVGLSDMNTVGSHLSTKYGLAWSTAT